MSAVLMFSLEGYFTVWYIEPVWILISFSFQRLTVFKRQKIKTFKVFFGSEPDGVFKKAFDRSIIKSSLIEASKECLIVVSEGSSDQSIRRIIRSKYQS